MYLVEEDRHHYEEQGYVLLPDLFSLEEVATLKQQIPIEASVAGPRAVLENDGRTVRAIHGSHATNEAFDRMARHPRLVKPAEQVLGSPVYVHQFKINVKAAFAGDVWKWHQDFIFWLKQDGMREPRAVNAMVFLDDVTEFNGPLLIVPGSHRAGVIDIPERPQKDGDWTASFAADLKYAITNETLADLVSRNGIVAPKGRAGAVLFIHCNLVHGSAPNMSPFNRALAIATYNSVENALLPVESPRPEFLVSRQFDPITPVAEDALLADSISGATMV
jgi:ectoine hydroxylase-related dioxygenase (phytanoyl-CoA dioxygenase family)